MTETVNSEVMLRSDDLADVKSYDDVLALLNRAGIDVVSSTEFGDGFAVVDKAALVNVPFILIDYKFSDGEYGEPFAIARIMTRDGRKGVITDGSTGIRNQLMRVAERATKRVAIDIPQGLVVSEYDYTDEKGKSTPAKTYYLSGM